MSVTFALLGVPGIASTGTSTKHGFASVLSIGNFRKFISVSDPAVEVLVLTDTFKTPLGARLT